MDGRSTLIGTAASISSMAVALAASLLIIPVPSLPPSVRQPEDPPPLLADGPGPVAKQLVGRPEEGDPVPPFRTPAKAQPLTVHPAAAPSPPKKSPASAPVAIHRPHRQAQPTRALVRVHDTQAAPSGILTPGAIRSIHTALHLTRDQDAFWFPVEQALQGLAIRQGAMVRARQNPADAVDTGAAMTLYWAARPLLASLREDQKALVRLRVRELGFSAVAAQI